MSMSIPILLFVFEINGFLLHIFSFVYFDQLPADADDVGDHHDQGELAEDVAEGRAHGLARLDGGSGPHVLGCCLEAISVSSKSFQNVVFHICSIK